MIIAVPYAYNRVDEEIRRHIESRFAEAYPSLDVRVHSAELVVNEGIRVRGLAIHEPGRPEGSQPIVRVDEIMIACDATLPNLLRQQVDVTKITLQRPALRAKRTQDGTWNVARLWPLPKFSDSRPDIVVENGAIEIVHSLGENQRAVTLRNVNVTAKYADRPESPPAQSPPSLASIVPSAGGNSAGGDTAPPIQSTVPRQPRSNRISIEGSASADHCRGIQFLGTVDQSTGDWDIGGTVDQLRISPEFLASLPVGGSAGGKTKTLLTDAVFHGRCDVDFRLRNDPDRFRLCLFEAAGKIKEGRLHHPRLPRALNDVKASFVLGNAGFSIKNLTAQTGQTTLRLTCNGTGFNEKSSLSLNGEVRDLELDSELFDCLPDHMRDQWIKFLPRGNIHCDFDALIAGGRFANLEGTIRLLDTSFTYHKMPYRVEHGRGTVTFKNGTFGIGVTAMAGNEPVRITGQTRMEGDIACGRIEIRGTSLVVDEKVLAALPEKPRGVIRSMHPRGQFDCEFEFWRDSPTTSPNKHLLLTLRRGTMRFDKFSYPISNIRGTAEMHPDGRWTFRGFDGQNDTGLISCEGTLTPTPEGSTLNLHLQGRNIALEEELRNALPVNMQRLWGYVRPKGSVDVRRLDLTFESNAERPRILLVASPRADTVSIEPGAFPYRLEQLEGTFVYRDGLVTFERFQARHEQTRVSGGGQCVFDQNGSWHLDLNDLFVDQLRFDRELIQAMPPALRQVHSTLRLQGEMNLRGTLGLARDSRPGAPLKTNWDVNMNIHQGALLCGADVKNINGGVHISGTSDGETLRSRGELAIDSLMYRNVQITDVRGPIWMDGSQLLMGKWVDRRYGADNAKTPRSLSGTLFGGRVFADGWVRLGETPRFGIQAKLAEADLHRCATEMISGRQKLRGKIWGDVDLRGSGCSMNQVSGRGQVLLRDADIYELPVMISLLKILSIRLPDTKAFSQSDIRFRIEGNHIYFDPIDFKGDAVSLLGKGEMDFQQNINLTFYPVVGRDELDVPLIRPLLKGASQQVMLVHVDGTVQAPRTTKEAFPGVNQALRELGFDLQDPILNDRRPPEGRQSAVPPFFSTRGRK